MKLKKLTPSGMNSSYALVALLALAATSARAADLPTSYTVDATALKAAVAGTNLTFDLYADSLCSGPIAHTETVAIENMDIISRLKLLKPKNAVKPPKTAELRQTLTGVNPAAAKYLKVTGTGITAVGGSCQVQAGVLTKLIFPSCTLEGNSCGSCGVGFSLPVGGCSSHCVCSNSPFGCTTNPDQPLVCIDTIHGGGGPCNSDADCAPFAPATVCATPGGPGCIFGG